MPDLVSTADLKQLEKFFERWKSKPWSVRREKCLGTLSQQIRKARAQLDGISKSNDLRKFGGKN